MKPGDLVRPTPLTTEEFVRTPEMLSTWDPNRDWKEHYIGNLLSHEHAVVLEVKCERGLEGCKVLTQSGLIGWLWSGLVEVAE